MLRLVPLGEGDREVVRGGDGWERGKERGFEVIVDEARASLIFSWR